MVVGGRAWTSWTRSRPWANRPSTTCATPAARPRARRDDLGRWIYPAALPNGKRVRVLKVLHDQRLREELLLLRRPRQPRRAPHQLRRPRSWPAPSTACTAPTWWTASFSAPALCASADHTMDRMIACVELIRSRYAVRRLRPPQAAARHLRGPRRAGGATGPPRVDQPRGAQRRAAGAPSPPTRTFSTS